MNKKGKAIFSILGAALLCGEALHATEPSMLGNLTETSVKISSIDMSRNSSEAAKIFSTFYSGAKTAGSPSQSDTVYFDGKADRRPSTQDIKRLCNSEHRKITKLGKDVPALTRAAGDIPEDKRPFYWHGPNPNPTNDPAIQQGLENGVNTYCANNPTAPACNPSNPYSPLHDPNSVPETDPEAYGSNYYWHNRLKEIGGKDPATFRGNAN